MTDPRATRIREISDRLAERRLVWFGIRGEDAAPLLPIPQFTDSFCITAPLEAGKLETSLALEDLTNHRVDLDAYDIDFDARPAVRTLRNGVLRSLVHPSVVASYRPSHFLSDLTFANGRTTIPLGMFKDRQIAFEHKPWVEMGLAEEGFDTIDWDYVPIERRGQLVRRLERGPLVLRPSRASGGAGISVVRTAEELESAWQDDSSHLMGVADYLEAALPLNVNACVYGPATVTVHPASVQLIGIAGYTNRRFGYCGNDFAAVRGLDTIALALVDDTTRGIGRWLGRMGFLGAFGVDYLLDGHRLYFAEVNARMQGSSRMASALASRTGHVDLLLDHISVFLGLPPAEMLTVADWMTETPPAAQVIRHNLETIPVPSPALDQLDVPGDARVVLLPAPGIRIEPGAVEYGLELDRRVTESGFELLAQPSQCP